MDNPPTSPPPQPGATPDPGARLTVQRYRIEHTLRFTYDAPVRLDQMVLRLQPRTDVNQRLFEFDIAADPQPTRQTHGIDLHGNIQHWFWFEDQHQDLTLHTRSMVDCYCDNPFDFVTVDQQAVTVPATYEEPVYTASARYRYRPNGGPGRRPPGHPRDGRGVRSRFRLR